MKSLSVAPATNDHAHGRDATASRGEETVSFLSLNPMTMKMRSLLFIAAALVGPDRLLAQDQTITGNLTVTGSISAGGVVDSDSNSLSFGSQGSSFGGALLYQDNGVDTFVFLANRNPASWLWVHSADIAAMRLNAGHQLVLYKSDGTTAGLVLSPESASIQLGTHASGTLTADANGVITAGGGFTAVGGITNTNGSLTGGASGLTLNAGGSNQSVAINPSGSGDVVIATSGAGDIVLGNETVTTYAGNLWPHSHNAFDLGASAQRWRSIYLQGTTVTGALVVETGAITGGLNGLTFTGGRPIRISPLRSKVQAWWSCSLR